MVRDNYLICPCCGKTLAIIKDESVLKGLVFFNTMPSRDGLTKALNEAHIELAAARREGNENHEREYCSFE